MGASIDRTCNRTVFYRDTNITFGSRQVSTAIHATGDVQGRTFHINLGTISAVTVVTAAIHATGDLCFIGGNHFRISDSVSITCCCIVAVTRSKDAFSAICLRCFTTKIDIGITLSYTIFIV